MRYLEEAMRGPCRELQRKQENNDWRDLHQAEDDTSFILIPSCLPFEEQLHSTVALS
jgi:hypothetical protein